MTEAHRPLSRRQIAWRAAQDLADGVYVNLGIGIPTLVSNYIPADREVILQSENGILGVGPAPAPEETDPDLINATKDPVSLRPGGSFFRHDDSFVMIRGGHIDLALLGGFQVSAEGDLANWRTDRDTLAPAVGGAMDLAVGAREIRVLMEHTTREGEPRILERCTYPLTAKKVVRRIYTSLAVIDVTPDGLLVREIVEGLGPERLRELTGARLAFAEDCRALIAPAL